MIGKKSKSQILYAVILTLLLPYSTYPLTVSDREVIIQSSLDGSLLKGSLTTPVGIHKTPAVLLIQGSGPLNRDEEVFGHSLLKDIAHFLGSYGITSLRMDRRGVGESEGLYLPLDLESFKSDSRDAFVYLRTLATIDTSRVGIVGHSLGGLIAAMTAPELTGVNHLLLLAPPGVWGQQIITEQNLAWARLSGCTASNEHRIREISENLYSLIINGQNHTEDTETFSRLYLEMGSYLEPSLQNMFYPGPADHAFMVFTMTHYRLAMQVDPESIYLAIPCPIMVILGTKDTFTAPIRSYDVFERVFLKAGCEECQTIMLKNHNHHLQRCRSGHPSEISQISESISQAALTEILEWIEAH